MSNFVFLSFHSPIDEREISNRNSYLHRLVHHSWNRCRLGAAWHCPLSMIFKKFLYRYKKSHATKILSKHAWKISKQCPIIAFYFGEDCSNSESDLGQQFNSCFHKWPKRHFNNATFKYSFCSFTWNHLFISKISKYTTLRRWNNLKASYL